MNLLKTHLKLLVNLKFFLILFLLSFSSLWAETSANYSSPFYLSTGISSQSIKTKDANLSLLGPTLEFRKDFENPKITYGGFTSFFISSAASLIGSQVGGYFGYKLFGSIERTNSIKFEKVSVMTSKTDASKYAAFFDIGFSLTPVFGSTTTTIYSGPYLGLSFYSHYKIPLQFALHLVKQSAGSSSFNSASVSLLYVFHF